MRRASNSSTANSSRWAPKAANRCARTSTAAGLDCWKSSSNVPRLPDRSGDARLHLQCNCQLEIRGVVMTELYVFPPSPRAFKVMALANYLGIEPTLHVLD